MTPADPSADSDTPRSEFAELYLVHYPRLVRVLTISTGEPEAAQDLAQETFARTYQRWRRVRAGPNPAGYLYTVAFHLLRRRGALAETPSDDLTVTDQPGASSHEEAVVTESVVHAVLAAMPPRRRACAALCLYMGFSADEAAATLAITPVTVRVQLHRARQALRVALSVDDHYTK